MANYNNIFIYLLICTLILIIIFVLSVSDTKGHLFMGFKCLGVIFIIISLCVVYIFYFNPLFINKVLIMYKAFLSEITFLDRCFILVSFTTLFWGRYIIKRFYPTKIGLFFIVYYYYFRQTIFLVDYHVRL